MDLKQLLGEELYNQIEAKLDGKKIMIDDGNFIPKQRFNEVNEAKKELSKQLADRDKQLEDLTVKANGNEELTKELEALKATNAKTVEEYEAKIKANEFNYALDNALSGAKSKNNKALKALLDIDSIKYQDGKLEGLETQIEALKKDAGYLFDLETAPTNTGGVGNFGRGKAQVVTKEQFENMSYTDRLNLFNDNKELYAQLTNTN